MGRMIWGQNNFSGGQIGQDLMAGTDLKEYANGAEYIKNFIPLKSRGLGRRTGTRFLVDITSWGASRLIPFNHGDGDYILVLRDMTTSNNFLSIYDTDGSSVTLTSAYTRVNGLAKEEWTYCQVGDFMVFCHLSGNIPPLVMTFDSSGPSFTIAPLFQGFGSTYFRGLAQGEINEGIKIPYLPENIDQSHLITPSSTTGACSLTASADVFDSGHIGSFFRITHSGTEGLVRITAVTDAQNATGQVVSTLGGTTGVYEWAEAAWSDYRGWPGIVTSFNERLVYMSTPSYPDYVWNSVAGNLWILMQDKLVQDASANTSGVYYFGPLDDSDAFDYIVNSEANAFIQWATSGESLQIGTERNEFISRGTNGKYGPLNGEVFQQSSEGGSAARPAKKGASSYYVSRDGKSVKEFKYNEANGSFISRDLSTQSSDAVYHDIAEASEDYATTAFIELVKNSSLDIIYGLTNNEELVGIGIKSSSDQIAWHTYDFGADAVHGVCTLPTANNSFENTYVCVERTINSSTKYYIEFMSQPYLRSDLDSGSSNDDEYPWYLDSAKKVTGSSITSITGLGHLEGETVRVLGDGADLGEYTVSSSAITLTTAVDVCIVGKEFTSYLRTLSPSVGSIFGDSTPFVKSINKTVMRVYKSLGGLWRSNDLDQESTLEYDVSGTELFTGDIKLNLGSSPSLRQFIEVETSDPFPLNVLGIFFRGEVEDGR